MTRASIVSGAFVTAVALLMLASVVRDSVLRQNREPSAATAPATAPSTAPTMGVQPGLLYGRITTVDGGIYEGRLRWGRDEEAFWSDYFNGVKEQNPWAAHAPVAQRPKERPSFEIFGFEIGGPDRPNAFVRPFMARFGDIARIDAHVAVVHVTLKSGSQVELDRFAAGDIDDGVRVWDTRRGVVDLDARFIRAIEFLPTAPLVGVADRLHGTVRTRQGEFTGFILWGIQDRLGDDELEGRTATVDVNVRYDRIRSIARRSHDGSTVTMLDGREMALSGTREAGSGHRGIYVDDLRYGRVMITWEAFERVDFSARGSGPAYDDFPPGRALAGSVTTHDGRRLAGRLVYDFDESETTETLDVARPGVDYAIPFSLIASIAPHGGDGRDGPTVTLLDGEELPLERTDDLSEGHAGMLIFVDGRERPEYVPWSDVQQLDFDRAPAPPALGAR